MRGGGLQPKIMEIKRIEALNTMPDGSCRTIKNQYYKNSIDNFESHGTFGATGVIEFGELKQVICASRGRNPENPSDRSAGIHLEQRLEPNEQGICNALTSVQKDNLVLEKKYIKVRQATQDGFVECEIGGGGGLGISDIRNPKGPRNRERKDMPDNNNGEYP